MIAHVRYGIQPLERNFTHSMVTTMSSMPSLLIILLGMLSVSFRIVIFRPQVTYRFHVLKFSLAVALYCSEFFFFYGGCFFGEFGIFLVLLFNMGEFDYIKLFKLLAFFISHFCDMEVL